MITVDNVHKHFNAKNGPVKALDGLSFAILPREILGIMGKSGAGKTTLLRLLSLQTHPEVGRLIFHGKAQEQTVDRTTQLASLRSLVQQSATVFQGFSLLYNRNVLDNTALPLKLRGVDRQMREAKAREMLNFVGLSHRAEAYPITLSGGEAQRVAIARALVTNPSILFLDEPTSSLDAQTTKEILDLLKKTHATYDVTMVLIAHQTDVVRYMCDRVLHLENGGLKHLGPVHKSDVFQVDNMQDIWEKSDV